MKKTTLAIVLAVFLAALLSTAGYCESQKIAVVDFEKCLTKSKKGARLGGEFRAKRDAIAKKITLKEDELKKMIADYEKQSPLMSAEAKSAKKSEFEKKKAEYQSEVESADKLMRQSGEELTSLVFKDLEGIIKDLAKKEGYSLILNSSGVWVLYYQDALDVTAEVIRLYDEKAAAEK
ncbi:OmpH family outer membrane protein [bacterium]|nr:MAG: OmpH family outer membrane protein [bacterium]